MAGKASNAALQDDEDTMVRMRRRKNIETLKHRRLKASKGLEYPNSPKPPVKRS